ncbi:hypothetical protein TNCV_2743191 [Trichonephila clavipes]|nr:hypothetical protein TNCV_2743191 [Trichonephila clavipes]
MPRAHQAGFRRRSLAGVGFFECVRCHGPDLALLTNGGVQQQQHERKDWTIDDWKRVIGSENSHFNYTMFDGRVRIWRK